MIQKATCINVKASALLIQHLNEPEHVAYLNMFEHNKSIKKKPKLRNAPLKIVCQASNGTLWLKRLQCLTVAMSIQLSNSCTNQ